MLGYAVANQMLGYAVANQMLDYALANQTLGYDAAGVLVYQCVFASFVCKVC